MKYYLSRLIEEAHRSEGFVSAFVYGPQGVGKTSYCLHVAADVYGSWEEALRHLYFDPTNAIDAMLERIEMLESGETDERIKVMIMDDAGVWLSKSSWWEESKQEFGELFDLVEVKNRCFSTRLLNWKNLVPVEISVKLSGHDGQTQKYSPDEIGRLFFIHLLKARI